MGVLKNVNGVLAVDRKQEHDIADGGDVYVVHSRLDSDVREQIARAIVNSNLGLHEMRPYTLSLEDIVNLSSLALKVTGTSKNRT